MAEDKNLKCGYGVPHEPHKWSQYVSSVVTYQCDGTVK